MRYWRPSTYSQVPLLRHCKVKGGERGRGGKEVLDFDVGARHLDLGAARSIKEMMNFKIQVLLGSAPRGLIVQR